jgi:hypothetical protein
MFAACLRRSAALAFAIIAALIVRSRAVLSSAHTALRRAIAARV